MSGIANGAAGAGVAPPPPPAFNLYFAWTGANPLYVNTASGSTSGSNRFVHVVTGGVMPYTENISVRSQGNTNGTGSISLFALGSQVGAAWNGLTNSGDAAYIDVQYDASDSAGASDSQHETLIIQRI